MPENSIKILQDKILISGEMTFATVTPLWKSSQKLFSQLSSLNCDFSEVTTCDSAGLALLLEWMKLAKQQNKPLRFIKLPEQLNSIARAAGLDGLLEAVS